MGSAAIGIAVGDNEESAKYFATSTMFQTNFGNSNAHWK